MKTVTLAAHFDGEHIQLDEPFQLPPNVRLLVTIIPEHSADSEREEWYALSKACLARAYADDEPDYTSIAEAMRRDAEFDANPDMGISPEQLDQQVTARRC